MQDAGTAIVGIGMSSGEGRAMKAVSQAIHSPLLEVSIDGAKGVLFGISGGKDLKMSEINDIAKTISDAVDPTAKIIFGAYCDKKMRPGFVKVTLIASGFSGNTMSKIGMSSPTSLFSSMSHENRIQTPAKEVKNEQGDKSDISKEKIQQPIAKKKSSEWDIPAFLRKGKK